MTYRSRGVSRASVDMSTDMSTSMSADTLTVEYRSSVGGLSVECRWSIGRLSYNIIDINYSFYTLATRYTVCFKLD